jgi:hypothetical protein
MTRIDTIAVKPLRANRARGLLAFAAAVAVCTVATAAQAGSFFDFLAGPPRPAYPTTYQSPYASPSTYASPDSRTEPSVRPEAPAAPVATGARAFCVRLCDGRYYPINSAASNSTPVQMCSAMCPAAKTKVFRGGDIATATDSSGTHYSRLDQAFAYRKGTVDACTCNGKDPYGLVQVDVASDPTLRSGDLVSTANGLKPVDGRNATRITSTPAERLSALRNQ